jgi:hypothetical protein
VEGKIGEIKENQDALIRRQKGNRAFNLGFQIPNNALAQQERKASNETLEWLTPIDYGPQQSDNFSRRQEGTGKWLLDSKEFQQWLNERKQTLFCPGMPGAGKTIITSIVVDHLHSKFRNDDIVAIAYLYCNFREQGKQTPTNLLLSLLKQFIWELPSIPESVQKLHNSCKAKRIRPTFDEISEVLHSVVATYSRSFIIVDALDEYRVPDGGGSKFLSEIFNLQAKTGSNLFVTSRFIPEIEQKFEGCLSVEVRATDDDVQRYIHNNMFLLPSFVLGSPTLQREIETEITKAVRGMYASSPSIIEDKLC